MVSNSDKSFEQELTILADSLVEHLEWARRSHVKMLPRRAQLAEMPTAKVIEEMMPVSQHEDIGFSIASLMTKKTNAAERLKHLQTEVIGDCRRCNLCENRSQIVFGSGDPEARLVFVGEGPGAEEDRLGEPFVGRSGQLLTKMIEAMGLSRDRIFICNVVKCRPPNNRDPEAQEVSSCMPFLKAQLAIIKPKVIVALGRYACQTLLNTTTPMSQLRGEWTQYEGIDLMPTFHPAFLLRNPPKKKEVWQDLQAVMEKLGLTLP